MYIRKTKTNNKTTGEAYFTHRLVRGERVQGKVRQITVLNLGRHFPTPQEDWPVLCQRIEQLISAQEILPVSACPDHIERAAQHYAGRLVVRAAVPLAAVDAPGAPAGAVLPAPAPDFQEVDVDSLQLTQPRSVGVEQVGLHALAQLGLIEKLTDLGVNLAGQVWRHAGGHHGQCHRTHGPPGLGVGDASLVATTQCLGGVD